MRLKKLELVGFKSFAEKVAFEFEQDVTALVGPNGAGKSNVIDAVRWVLGEQSAHNLRSREMADVIFHGNKSHAPLGYAEVTLSIDNKSRLLPVEYDELSIRRRVYRSGEGEYFINKHACRLKDIRALLMDTGMGVGYYNIIEQGQVDLLLQASAKERRAVFEEAAGINRYLQQKREAERKLEHVKTNLERLADILEEVQRQLRSVKYQAAKARRYRRLSQQLEGLRLAHGLHVYQDLVKEGIKAGKSLKELQESKLAVEERYGQVSKELSETQKALEGLREDLMRAGECLTQIRARQEGISQHIALNTKRMAELEAQNEELLARNEQLMLKLANLQEELKGVRNRLAESEEKLESKTRLTQTKQEGLRRGKAECEHIQRSLEEQKADVFDLMQQESQLQNQTAVLESEKRTLQNRRSRLSEQRQNLQQGLSQAQKEAGDADANLRSMESRVEAVKCQIETLDRELARASAELERVASEKTEAKAELSALCSRKQLLEDLQARGEGIGRGVRALLDAASGGHIKGCIGLIADLVSVEIEYAAAVEAALGESVQAVLFKTTEQAREALNFVQREGTGRAHLLPLDRLRLAHRPEALQRPGMIGPLSELVGCPAEIRAAVDHLLGNSVLVEDAGCACSLLEDGLPEAMRLVTPAGECFEVAGAWTAGRPGKESLISRKSELRQLNSDLPALQERIETLTALKNRCRGRIEELASQRSALSEEKEQASLEESELRGQLRILENRRHGLKEEIKLNQAEQAAMARDIEEADRRLRRLNQQIAELQAQRHQRESAVAHLQNQLSERNEQNRILLAELSALASEQARLQEQRNSLAALGRRVEEESARSRTELEQLQHQLTACRNRHREAAAAIESARAEKQSLSNEKDRVEEKIRTQSAHCTTVKEQIARLEDRSAQVSQQREELEGKLQECRLRENETRLKIENLTERIRDDYGVNLCALELEPDQWRTTPLFCNRRIKEFSEDKEQRASVARWYQEAQQEGNAEPAEAQSLTLEEATQYRDSILALAGEASTDWAEVKKQADVLKKKLDSMGSVNLEAIRQQDELEIRERFLSDQIQDLERARRHEQEIIRELNKKSRERFRETFESVRQSFQELFRKLFGGGMADLVLDGESEDILDASIEIVARPPGKETRFISLLSGGEKALTTVALLFAIFKARPSPFCLLDEVDATLDENNVGRFVALLKEFLPTTQFVIVTHNKLTMSIAEVLYGITLEELGMSKKISVRFEDVDNSLKAMSRETKAAKRRARAG